MFEILSTAIGLQSSFSPNGAKYVLSLHGSRVTVREIVCGNEAMSVKPKTFSCLDKIESAQFSPDGQLVSCSIPSRSVIQVFSLEDTEWKCRINEGMAGLIGTQWAPDSRHIFALSDFGIQIGIWSLIDSTCHVVANPKQIIGGSHSYNAQNGVLAISDDYRFFAVLHRFESQDHIGVYSMSPLEELGKFKSRSHEVCSVHWTPSGHHIIALDSPLTYRMNVYTPSGELLISYEAYQNALGIRSLGLSYPSFGLNSVVSSPAMIALGSFDGKTRILSRNSLQLCFVLTSGHPRDMDSAINTRNVVTSVEVPSHDSYNPAAIDGDVTSRRMPLSDLSTNQPDRIFLSTGRLSDTKTSPADSTHYAKRMMKTLPRCAIASKTSSYPVMGVHWLQWSPDGDYLATRDESYPRCLWIWKPLEAKLVALLVQLDNISSVSWQPQRTREGSVQESRLALCTSSSKVYTWTPSFGAEIHQPLSTALALKRSNNEDDVTHTAITSLEWSADGKCILLRGKESFTVCRVE